MSTKLVPDLLRRALTRVEPTASLWLVGGAVRDHFLHRETFDFDLVSAENALGLARSFADAWSGDFYTLDSEREVGRALLRLQGRDVRIDIARIADAGIRADLAQRDFTINAMGVSIGSPSELIDPTGGLQDLKDGLLRACGKDSIDHDPLRALRASRMASQFALSIEKSTVGQLRAAAAKVGHVPGERRRDEIFRTLMLSRPESSLRLLQHLGLLEPAICSSGRTGWLGGEPGLRGISTVVDLLEVLTQQPDNQRTGTLALAEASLHLGRYRARLNDHFQEVLSADRTRREAAILAVLLRAAVDSPAGDGDGGEGLARSVARDLRLSRRETGHLRCAVAAPHRIAGFDPSGPSPVEIYRYFSAFGQDGVEGAIVWLALGETADDAHDGPDGRKRRVRLVRALFAALYESEVVDLSARPLVSGSDLMSLVGIREGPALGRILDEIREAHAVGVISDRDEALQLARKRWHERQQPPEAHQA